MRVTERPLSPSATASRVLLVEDQATSLRPELEQAGFAVTHTGSLATAFAKMSEQTFDLVLGDFRLAATDGLALVRRMKERSVDLPTVLVFETTDNASTLEANALGVQCLVKPVNAGVLKRAGELAAAAWERATARAVSKEGAGVNPLSVSVTASAAKNEFGHLLETALRGQTVVITKHDVPKAVLLAMDAYDKLVGQGDRRLNTLSTEFDSMLARMQAPGVRAKMKAAFGADSGKLGDAALRAATKNRG